MCLNRSHIQGPDNSSGFGTVHRQEPEPRQRVPCKIRTRSPKLRRRRKSKTGDVLCVVRPSKVSGPGSVSVESASPNRRGAAVPSGVLNL
jgi:hypothetical protein